MRTLKRASALTVCAVCFVIYALAIVMGPVGVTAYAADEQTGLTVNSVCGGEAVRSVLWKAYLIGSRKDTGGFELNETFSGSGVSLDDVSEEAVKAAAEQLGEYIFANAIQPDFMAYSDDSGAAAFAEAGAGIYYLEMSRADIGDYSYSALPAVAEVKAGKLTEVNAKIERAEIVESKPSPDDTSSKPGDDDSNSRQSQGGDDGDSRGTGADDDNPAESKPPKDTQPSDDSQPSKLPQTGLLWWPVPVCALAGLVLVALGVRLNGRRGGKDE